MKKIRIPKWLRNKYVFTSVVFVLWMTFFDSNDLFKHLRLINRLKEVNRIKSERIAQIEETRMQLKDLQHKSTQEKFARETYFFKKANEEVYVIVEEEEEEN